MVTYALTGSGTAKPSAGRTATTTRGEVWGGKKPTRVPESWSANEKETSVIFVRHDRLVACNHSLEVVLGCQRLRVDVGRELLMACIALMKAALLPLLWPA